jgi:hypothetical protein
MRKATRWVLIVCITAGASWAQVARADVSNTSAQNAQQGDDSSHTNQQGSAGSGDAVAGQVVGVVSSGDTSVDATNRSDNVDVSSGDARADNSAAEFVGLSAGANGVTGAAADLANGSAFNVQEGDNKSKLNQTADAITGDLVCGQVVGAVTSTGGSADLVLGNTSVHSDCASGDATFSNSEVSSAGLDDSVPIDTGCPLPLDVSPDKTAAFAGISC